jgi:hypothetical protein
MAQSFDPTDPAAVRDAQARAASGEAATLAARAALVLTRSTPTGTVGASRPRDGGAAARAVVWHCHDRCSGLAGAGGQRAALGSTRKRSPAARAEFLLQGIATRDGFSQAERNLAELVLNTYRAAGVPLPRVEIPAGTGRCTYRP